MHIAVTERFVHEPSHPTHSVTSAPETGLPDIVNDVQGVDPTPQFPAGLEHWDRFLEEMPFAQCAQFGDFLGSFSPDASFVDFPTECLPPETQSAFGEVRQTLPEALAPHETVYMSASKPIQPIQPLLPYSALTSSNETGSRSGNCSNQNSTQSHLRCIPGDPDQGNRFLEKVTYSRQVDNPHNQSSACAAIPTFSTLPISPSQASAEYSKGFNCSYCSKHFVRRCDLNKHVATHTRPYACTVTDCTQAFPSRKDRDRHLGDKHSSNDHIRYFCKHTDCIERVASFKRKDNRNKHFRKAHGRNPTVDED